MGAFRSQLEALGVQKFWDGTNNTYSSGAGFWYSNAVIGSGQIRLGGLSTRASLVKTETTPGLNSTFFIPDVRSIWNMTSNPADVGTLVLTGIFEGDLTPTPPVAGPDVISSYGASRGPDNANSYGFFRVDYRDTTTVAWWDLHITPGGNIGIATWTDYGWGDLLHVDSRPATLYKQWMRRELFVFDTGFPAAKLFDGRPHLVTTRFRGHSQINNNSNDPLPQDNWIKVTIDGTALPTTTRGPGVITYVPWLEIGTSAFDDVATWDYNLTDAEIASLWGSSVWGDPWPHPGAGLTTSAATAAVTESIVRVVDWAPNFHNISGPRVPQKWDATVTSAGFDPTWIEEETAGSASASAIVARSSMGDATSQLTWEEMDTWAALPVFGPKLADRWLDEQDVALLTGPLRGLAGVTGSLDRESGREVGVSSGRSSVSGVLVVAIPLEAAPVHGACTVYAITIGDLTTLAVASAGVAAVVGSLSHGQLEYLSGSSAGGSTVTADLRVTRYSYIGGDEVGDGEHAPLMGAGGRRRAHFSPKSVGHVTKQGLKGAAGVLSGGSLGS